MPLRLVFMGTPDFAVPTLSEIAGRGHDIAAVYTRAPKPAGRGMDLKASPVEREARLLGLPPETLLTFGVMIFTVLMPIFVSKAKPYLDALVYMQDHAEIDYLRTLPRNTFTHADLRSLLENTLVVSNSTTCPALSESGAPPPSGMGS